MAEQNEPSDFLSKFLLNIWAQALLTTILTVVWLLWIAIEILGVLG